MADIAISNLYLIYRRRVYKFSRKLIAKHYEYRGTAKDLVHDSFILMIQKIQFENVQIHSVRGFWIGVAKNIFLNQLKKDERIVCAGESEEKYGLNEVTPESIYLAEEEREQMANTFSQLGPRCRQVLLLWLNQYSMYEIAQQMSLSNVAMARKLKYGCFRKLKELVKTRDKMPG